MKQLIVFIFTLLCFTAEAQIADMPAAEGVSVTINGLQDNFTIAKSKLIKAKEFDLIGPNAKKFSIQGYTATYTGKDGLTEEEMEGPMFSVDMENFFHIIEKSARLSFKNIILKSEGKLYKLPPMNLIVHGAE